MFTLAGFRNVNERDAAIAGKLNNARTIGRVIQSDLAGMQTIAAMGAVASAARIEELLAEAVQLLGGET